MKITAFSAGLFAGTVAASCKCFPGDACWPKIQEWNKFNQTVSGRLIATVPLAEACHDPKFNSAACQSLRDQWQFPDIQ